MRNHNIFTKIGMFLSNTAQHYKPERLAIFLAVILVFMLLWAMTTGLNNQFIGDDLVYQKLFNERSIPDVVVSFYKTFTGRLSNLFSLGILFTVVPSSYLMKFTAVLSLGLLYISTYTVFNTIFRSSQKRLLFSHLLSSAIVLCLYCFGPAKYDDFYWVAGIVTYIIPLCILNFVTSYLILATVQKKQVNISKVMLVICASVFGGMFNEAFSVQVLLLFGIASLYFIGKRKFPSPYAITSFLGYFIGLLIMRLAPGTTARINLNKQLNPVSISFLETLTLAAKNSYDLIASAVQSNLSGIMFVVILSSYIGYFIAKEGKKAVKESKRIALIRSLLLLSAASAIILTQYYVFSFVFAYSSFPTIAQYAIITSHFVAYMLLSICFIYFGNIWGKLVLPDKLQRKVNLSLVIIGVIPTLLFIQAAAYEIYRTNQLIVLQRDEAHETQQEIKEQIVDGKQELVIQESVSYFTYCIPVKDPKAWCNVSLSSYYGVKNIRAEQEHFIGKDTDLYEDLQD